VLKEETMSDYVLNQNSSRFDQDFDLMIHEVKPNILVDFLGGEFPMKLFEKMQKDSILVPVGCLTGDKLVVDFFNLVTQNKKIIPFHLEY